MASDGLGRRRARARLLALAVALAGIVAAAEPTPADRETARSLMNEGDRKIRADDVRGALAAYEAADAIMGVPTTSIEVARMRGRLGMLVEARDAALKAEHYPVVSGEPRPFKEARVAAERMAADLSRRIPAIRIELEGATADDVTIEVDGEPLPKLSATSPRKVNPGKHVVAAYGSAFARVTNEVVVHESETRECVLALTRVSVAVESAPAATVPMPLAAVAAPDSSEPRTSPLLYVGASLVGLGLISGAVTGVAEILEKNRIDCSDTRDDAVCDSRKASAQRLATISNISFGAAAGGAAIAIFALIRSNGASSHPPVASSPSFTLSVGQRAISISTSF